MLHSSQELSQSQEEGHLSAHRQVAIQEKKAVLPRYFCVKVPNGTPNDPAAHMPIPWTKCVSTMSSTLEGKEGQSNCQLSPNCCTQEVPTVWHEAGVCKKNQRQKKNHSRQKAIDATPHYTDFSTFHFNKSQPFLKSYTVIQRQINKRRPELERWEEQCPPLTRIPLPVCLTPKVIPQETPLTLELWGSVWKPGSNLEISGGKLH